MIIAVLSDIHDHLHHLGRVIEALPAHKPERLFFLGDFCAPFSLGELAKGFSGPIDCVFGNNDGDEFLLCRIAGQHPHVTLHGQYAELEADGRRIALNHYPEIGKRLAESGAFDAVFSGHDHQRWIRPTGDTLWANPGEIMGRFGTVSFGIYDTETGEFRHVIV